MFECVQICTVSDTLHALQRPPPVRSYRRRPVWYRVRTGAACPAFGRVCRALRGLPWYLPALVLAWSALLPVMCNLSGRVGVPGGNRAGGPGGGGESRLLRPK
nr:MAG TPA: hypothetical protein [Caudoviricetes sp.]